MINFDKDTAYRELFCKFHALIDEQYQEGEWFPPVRKLCRDFDVCRATYLKAINHLVTESVVRSYPRKGIYIIPSEYRLLKIGIVLGRGQESPFVPGMLLANVMSELYTKGYESHLIHGSNATNVIRSALTHCVAGLIWIDPPVSAFQVMADVNKNKILPLLAINAGSPPFPEETTLGIPVVSQDAGHMAANMAEFFIDRRHKKVGYVGTKADADYSGLTEKLKEGGIVLDEDMCIGGNGTIKPGMVKALVSHKKATGLIIEGGIEQFDFVFKELSSLPEKNQPEVMVHWHRKLGLFCRKYPKVKLMAVGKFDTGKLGGIVADLMVNSLNTSKKLCSKKVKLFHIDPFNELKSKG
mgnify:CR=1 FL=1